MTTGLCTCEVVHFFYFVLPVRRSGRGAMPTYQTLAGAARVISSTVAALLINLAGVPCTAAYVHTIGEPHRTPLENRDRGAKIMYERPFCQRRLAPGHAS